MNLLNLMPKLRENLDADVELTEEELREERRKIQAQHNRRRGPGHRFPEQLSNGAIRRLQARQAKAEKRKMNSRRRRQWMAQQGAVATLRGQLVVVGALPQVGRDSWPSPDLYANAMTGLRKVFGFREPVGHEEGPQPRTDDEIVDAALEAYHQIVARRAS